VSPSLNEEYIKNAGMYRKESGKKSLSVVIPVYNEKDSIGHLYGMLDSVLSKIDIPYEVILIDDGSSDGTYDELVKIHDKNNAYRIISFRKISARPQP